MDFLTVTLCMCIGTAVAWLFALYTPRGAHLLFWNTFFGMLGAALCALAIFRFAPVLSVVGLVIAGPLCAPHDRRRQRNQACNRHRNPRPIFRLTERAVQSAVFPTANKSSAY